MFPGDHEPRRAGEALDAKLAQRAVDENDRHHLTKLDHFKVFREYRLREHELLNHRITWNLTIQGLLFAAYGFSLQKLTEVEAKALIDGPRLLKDTIVGVPDVTQGTSYGHLTELIYTIPWVGIGLSFVVLLAVAGSWIALNQLGKQWDGEEEKKNGVKHGYPEKPHLPSPAGAGSSLAAMLGFGPPLAIPCVFIVAWLRLWWLLPHRWT